MLSEIREVGQRHGGGQGDSGFGTFVGQVMLYSRCGLAERSYAYVYRKTCNKRQAVINGMCVQRRRVGQIELRAWRRSGTRTKLQACSLQDTGEAM